MSLKPRLFGGPLTAIAAGAICIANAAAQEKAAEPPVSWISGAVSIEVQNDRSYRSDDPANERNDLFAKIEPEVTISVPPLPGLSFTAHGVLEPVADPQPGDSRAFEDQGFFIQELYANYRQGPFGVRAGKFNPAFGIAWDLAPGVYGTDIAEDYEITERIGLAGGVEFGAGGWGVHALSAGTFFADTTPLAHSVLSESRGTMARSDGGVANTEDFSSFNVVLEGGKFAGAPDFLYHLAYVRQAHGVDGTDDETGVALALANGFDMGSGVSLTPLVEFVSLDNLGGAADTDRTYWTGALALAKGGWTAAASYTRRRTDMAGGPTARDWQLSFGVGYAFDSGLGIDVGWKRLREDSIETDTAGALITYGFEF